MNQIKKNEGFTLIEILVVIGIIAVLATIVLIAINPARQFAQAHNTQRTSNIETILNAVGQRIADNKGNFAGTLNGVTCPAISTTTAQTIESTGGIDLSCLVPTYIASQLPVDPTAGNWASTSTYDTGYTIIADAATGRITVDAPSAELSSTISIAR